MKRFKEGISLWILFKGQGSACCFVNQGNHCIPANPFFQSLAKAHILDGLIGDLATDRGVYAALSGINDIGVSGSKGAICRGGKVRIHGIAGQGGIVEIKAPV